MNIENAKKDAIVIIDRKEMSEEMANRLGGLARKICQEELSEDSIKGKALMKILETTMTVKECKVIELHYGLSGNAPKNLKEIGEEFAVSGSRIQQIEAKALRKLRHPKRMDKFRPNKLTECMENFGVKDLTSWKRLMDLIPSEEKNAMEAFWGLDDTEPCTNFQQLDEKLKRKGTKWLYEKAEADIRTIASETIEKLGISEAAGNELKKYINVTMRGTPIESIFRSDFFIEEAKNVTRDNFLDKEIACEICEKLAEYRAQKEKIKTYYKLVRDNIPAIIEAEGRKAKIRQLTEKEYKIELDKKLQEEVAEYLQDDSTEELADIAEVLYAILDFKEIPKEEFEQIRKAKAARRGAFREKIFLEEVW